MRYLDAVIGLPTKCLPPLCAAATNDAAVGCAGELTAGDLPFTCSSAAGERYGKRVGLAVSSAAGVEEEDCWGGIPGTTAGKAAQVRVSVALPSLFRPAPAPAGARPGPWAWRPTPA